MIFSPTLNFPPSPNKYLTHCVVNTDIKDSCVILMILLIHENKWLFKMKLRIDIKFVLN